MIRYIFQSFLMWTLSLMAAAIILEDIQTEYAHWIMILWVAVIGEFLLEKPISAIWKKK